MQHSAPHSAFIPHGFCYLWDRALLWTHVTSDLLIGLSYVAISLSLAYLVHRARREIPFSVLFIAFGLFIVACGGTHFMEIWTLWYPSYWASAGVKVVTAAASVATAAAMPVMVPRILAMIQDAGRAGALSANLARTSERLDFLVRSSPAVLYSRAAEHPHAFTFVGENMRTILGGNPDQLVADPSRWSTRVHADDHAGLLLALERVASEREIAVEYRVRDDAGSYRWVLDQMRYVDDGRRGAEIVGWWTEATERHVADETRRQLDHMKSEFVSTVSHELRTPLTAIRGSLGLVDGGKAGALDPKTQRLVHVAVDNTDRLIRLVNDLLDLDKIEAGQLELRLTTLAPGELLDASIEGIRPFADQYGIRLERDNTGTHPIFGDRDRLIQVLTNLLSNAIKFAPPRTTVRISSVDSRPANTAEPCIRFVVENAGVGIAAKDVPRLFQRFSQLDAGDNRRRGGTGLGLAISKAIVEQHGGRIGVESEPNVRTAFWFDVPASTEVLLLDHRV